MKLSEFRELTKDLSGDSELVLWVYIDIYNHSDHLIPDDGCDQGVTDFQLSIDPWTEGKYALHFHVDKRSLATTWEKPN